MHTLAAVPATTVVRQSWGPMGVLKVRKIEFEFGPSGRLAAGPFSGHRFSSRGELD